MPITAYPAGVATYGGLPIVGTGPIQTTGDVLFVDVNHSRASDGASSGDRNTPCSSVQQAITNATASQGDIIFVMPGHTETIDGDITINKVGLSVIGLGVGLSRPTFDFTAAGDTITTTAADCRISNIILSLDSSAITVTAGFTVAAAGTTIDHTRIMPHATRQFTGLCTLGDFDDVTIAYNSWYTLIGASSTTGLSITGTAERTIVNSNSIMGNFGSYAIGASAANLDAMITNNIFRNANVAEVILMNAASTGLLANNAFSTGASAITAAEAFDMGNMFCVENFMCNAVDESGGPIPTAAAA